MHGLRGIARYLIPWGRNDLFWDNAQTYFTDSEFYLGVVLGIQADSTNTASSCISSYNTMTSSVSTFAAYDMSTFTTNLAASSTTTFANYGYYAMLARKF